VKKVCLKCEIGLDFFSEMKIIILADEKEFTAYLNNETE